MKLLIFLKKRATIIVSVLVVVILYGVYSFLSPKETLPVYNPSDFNPELVDKSLQGTTEDHTVADFKLINQNGEIITQEDYQDKIYVADFFFTRCPSICPIMTDNLVIIQEEFLNNYDIMLLSLSIV